MPKFNLVLCGIFHTTLVVFGSHIRSVCSCLADFVRCKTCSPKIHKTGKMPKTGFVRALDA